jgi:hypothetical protein
MLQDKIDEIKPYFKSIETYGDALIVRINFPPKWAVFNSDSGKIKVAASDRKAYEYFYYGDGNEVSLEDIFDFIKNTIEVNQSLEIKAKLLVQKAKELQDLFEVTPLEKLKTLEFTMKEPKKARAKRKYTKRKKVQENVKEEPISEPKETIINEEPIAEEKTKVEDTVKEETSGSTNQIKISPTTLNKFEKAKKRREAK